MKEPATTGDIYFIIVLVIGLFFCQKHDMILMNKNEMQIIKPIANQIDSIADHVQFVDSSHFDWCGFVPNKKYQAFGE